MIPERILTKISGFNVVNLVSLLVWNFLVQQVESD